MNDDCKQIRCPLISELAKQEFYKNLIVIVDNRGKHEQTMVDKN